MASNKDVLLIFIHSLLEAVFPRDHPNSQWHYKITRAFKYAIARFTRYRKVKLHPISKIIVIGQGISHNSTDHIKISLT